MPSGIQLLWFGAKFPVYFSDVPLIQKNSRIGFWCTHFVKEHTTVGLFSEEEGKSIHHAIRCSAYMCSLEAFTVKASDRVAWNMGTSGPVPPCKDA